MRAALMSALVAIVLGGSLALLVAASWQVQEARNACKAPKIVEQLRPGIMP